MNAAEITDKLGLHSLRQRAWVSIPNSSDFHSKNLTISSTSNRLAPHLEMVFTKVWSGLQALSKRLVTSRFDVNNHPSTTIPFCKLPQNNRTKVHNSQNPSSLHTGLLVLKTHDLPHSWSSSAGTSIRGVRVVLVRWGLIFIYFACGVFTFF